MDRLKKWFPVLAILLLVLIMTFPLFAAAFEWSITAADLLGSFSTLLAGACAIAAALLTVNTMNKHNKAQIEKITEINEIEEFHRYKKDFEDQYQEIINEFIKSQHTNFKISKKNIFYVIHDQKNCIGVPKLNYKTLMIIRKRTENIIDMYNYLITISPDSIPSAAIVMNIAEAIKTNIEICGEFLYCAEITDAIRNRDSAQYIAYKLSDIEIAHIIKLH
ncbi:MAG: hypothetical protein KBT77_06085, partial [Thalassolituus oleivorans]|uniref:hypothetical protein n=1 Tax=Thalassolituus oleivorans TaxID=187493 RepID=UPI001B497FFF